MDIYTQKGHKDLARDPETNGIINVNNVSYDHYIASRKSKSEKNQKVQTMVVRR